MQYNNQAYLSLVWKDPKERKQYLIGRLSKGEEFVFKYDDEIKNALKAGFHPLLAFSNLKQEYHSKLMFPSFSSRLPDPKRKDINKILNKYNMDEYDAYTLLQRGGARLPIDSLEFIDPILENETGDIKRNFYVGGVRHYNKCEEVVYDADMDSNHMRRHYMCGCGIDYCHNEQKIESVGR